MSTVNEIKVTALKREITVGIDDLVHGRFQTFNDTNFMQWAKSVGRFGRIQLNALRPASGIAAKVQRKK